MGQRDEIFDVYEKVNFNLCALTWEEDILHWA